MRTLQHSMRPDILSRLHSPLGIVGQRADPTSPFPLVMRTPAARVGDRSWSCDRPKSTSCGGKTKERRDCSHGHVQKQCDVDQAIESQDGSSDEECTGTPLPPCQFGKMVAEEWHDHREECHRKSGDTTPRSDQPQARTECEKPKETYKSIHLQLLISSA